jgi:hypothetical protein
MGNHKGLIFTITLLMLVLYGCQPIPAPAPTTVSTIEATQTEAPTPTITPSPTRPVDPVTLRILFIGSSHIYYSRAAVDLPKVFTFLASAGGHTVLTDRIAQSGDRLQDHVANPSTLEVIESAEWDYVVLQENMYIAADSAKREEQMYPAVRTLDQWIKDNGAQTILYLTWVNPGPIRFGEIDKYYDEQARLTEGYLEIAQELDALVAPAGIAFENVLRQNPDIYLWYEGDEQGHASGMGQYLTAAVFYALIYQESPEGLGYLLRPEEMARLMQSIAAETVLTSP